MVRSAADPSRADSRSAPIAASTLLLELREAHANLHFAMQVMEGLTHGLLADRNRYAAARWRISQASLSRRTLWGRIYRHVIADAGPADAAALNDLQADEMRMLHCSAAHVGRWTMAAIDEDWAGYCRASEAVRRQLADRTEAERRLLYPILDRLSQARGDGPARPASAPSRPPGSEKLTASRSPSALS